MVTIERKTFSVTPVGVGRKDYSQNVEFSVEPLVRSHLRRTIWIGQWIAPSVPYPDAYTAHLHFTDKAGNLLLYVPSDVKYIIYNIIISGDYNALTVAGLLKATYPDFVVVDTIAEVYSYGQATVRLTKGHKCEPGRVYFVTLNQWSENPTCTLSLVAYAVSDEVVG